MFRQLARLNLHPRRVSSWLIICSTLALLLCFRPLALRAESGERAGLTLSVLAGDGRIDCAASRTIVLQVGDAVPVKHIALTLAYDPRVIEVEHVEGQDDRMELSVDMRRHVDLRARATAEAAGDVAAPKLDWITLVLRMPGGIAIRAEPAGIVQIRLRGLAAGESPLILLRARALSIGGDALAIESEEHVLRVTCPGMTPVPVIETARERNSHRKIAGNDLGSVDQNLPAAPASLPIAGRDATLDGRGAALDGRGAMLFGLESRCRHRIGLGETLVGVALDRGVSVMALMRANAMRRYRPLVTGLSLRIPDCAIRASDSSPSDRVRSALDKRIR